MQQPAAVISTLGDSERAQVKSAFETDFSASAEGLRTCAVGHLANACEATIPTVIRAARAAPFLCITTALGDASATRTTG